jgi:DNA-binding NtrC family response regulator
MDNVRKAAILVLDPARSLRNGLRERLSYEGFEVDTCESLSDGYAACRDREYELLLVDGDLADEHIRSARHGSFGSASPIILSANPSIETAVYAIREGAWDFVAKPVDMNLLLKAIRSVLEMRAAEREYAPTGKKSPGRRVVQKAASDESGIIGKSQSIEHVKDMIDRVAPKDTWVMITGPNGSGKEMVAKELHYKSKRADGPFVEVNCAAIPSELIESELFGHEKGAFTTAVRQRKGKFEQADGGTLFLDEVGDMSLSAQAKVLRALQEHKVSRVGGDKDIEVDVRVVSATNKNLPEEIDNGRFREDLYHRLSVIEIRVPPLKDRVDDIPLLMNYFVDTICNDYDIEPKEVDVAAVELLKKHGWAGNVRELRNVVERLIVLCGDRITEEDVRMYAVPAR